MNKIKVIKRIIYGRNSFELLKAKYCFPNFFTINSDNYGRDLSTTSSISVKPGDSKFGSITYCLKMDCFHK